MDILLLLALLPPNHFYCIAYSYRGILLILAAHVDKRCQWRNKSSFVLVLYHQTAASQVQKQEPNADAGAGRLKAHKASFNKS